MTNDILLADIDYARRQMKDSAPDAAIVAGLISRGIEPAKAAQLVDDLRQGRRVTPALHLVLRSRTRRSTRPPGASPARPNSAAAPGGGTQDQGPAHGTRSRTTMSLKTRLIGGALAFAAFALAAWALYHYRFSPEAQDERVPAPTNAAPPASAPSNLLHPAPTTSPVPAHPTPPPPSPGSYLHSPNHSNRFQFVLK